MILFMFFRETIIFMQALYNKICHFQPILESTPDLIEETFVCADFTVCVYFQEVVRKVNLESNAMIKFRFKTLLSSLDNLQQLRSRYRPRFFDQVGHQTTSAYRGCLNSSLYVLNSSCDLDFELWVN